MYNVVCPHTCDVSVKAAVTSYPEIQYVESLSQYEPLDITIGDVSSHYLNPYDTPQDGDRRMKWFH